ncbi:hypothetical protein [Streptomyces sp. NBC_00872]|uniref:hypothetical protein n=1 Tax=Streptomyces sp. NBC_00872 TaxID=2903686 RepID=UPI003864BC1F|nr:hypothetical protein OG214_38355 [Streptomyces sp. NBC_00872]
MDDDVVLVQVEAAPRTSTGSVRVCVRSDVGTAVVLWAGASEEAGGEHHVEWSIDEDVSWGSSMWPAAVPSFGLWEDGGRLVFRGRLSFTDDGGARLEFAGALILLSLATPGPPEVVSGIWVEVQVLRSSVSLYPYLL